MHKKEIVEAVTIIETPPVVVVGLVGYIETPRGLRSLTTVWAEHFRRGQTSILQELVQDARRRLSPSTPRSTLRYSGSSMTRELERIKKYCTVVRVLAHTQIRKIKIGQKKVCCLKVKSTISCLCDNFINFTNLFYHSSPT